MHSPGTLAFLAKIWAKEHLNHHPKGTDIHIKYNRVYSILQVVAGRSDRFTTYRNGPVLGTYQLNARTGKWYLIGIKPVKSELFIEIEKSASLNGTAQRDSAQRFPFEAHPGTLAVKFEEHSDKMDPFDIYQVDGFRCLVQPIQVEFVKTLNRPKLNIAPEGAQQRKF